MKEIERIKTRTYEAENGFYVDIVHHTLRQNGAEPLYEAYLYHKQYGIKSLMFGSNDKDYQNFLAVVMNNLPQYMEYYEDDYFD